MSGLVLLIALFNLANMLLARRRATPRFPVRAGDRRSRLIRQLLVEGFVLAAAGGGLLLSVLVTTLLVASLAAFSPVADRVRRRAGPARGACDRGLLRDCDAALQPRSCVARADSAAGSHRRERFGGGRRLRLQHVLVMGQLALSLVMLTVGGIFLRSAVQAQRLHSGLFVRSRRHRACGRTPGTAGGLHRRGL